MLMSAHGCFYGFMSALEHSWALKSTYETNDNDEPWLLINFHGYFYEGLWVLMGTHEHWAMALRQTWKKFIFVCKPIIAIEKCLQIHIVSKHVKVHKIAIFSNIFSKERDPNKKTTKIWTYVQIRCTHPTYLVA